MMFLITFLTGFLIIKSSLCDLKNNLLIFALAAAFGIASESLIVFILMITGFNNVYSIAGGITGLFFAALYTACKRKIKLFEEVKKDKGNTLLKILFCIMFLINIVLISIHIAKEPQGSWDGMFLWNLHSKFLYTLQQEGEDWTLFFNDALAWNHLDYPMLLPVYNYKNQLFNFEYSHLVPLAASLIFYIAVLSGLTGFVKELTDTKNALAAGIVLMSLKPFIWESASQCADIPLSLYILCAAGCLFLFEKYKNQLFIFYSFFFAGACAFLKNEGIVFFAVFLILSLIFMYNSISKRMIAAGCALPLFCLIYFKLFIYSASDLIQSQTFEIIKAKLFDIERIKLISINFINNLFETANAAVLFIAAVFSGIRKVNRPVIISIMLLIIMFLVYAGVYLISPHDLYWHLMTSSMRLFVQYIPIFILVVFTVFNCCDKNHASSVLQE